MEALDLSSPGPAKPRVAVGLDLGKVNDYTALVVSDRERRDDDHLHHVIRHLERLPLGTPYPVVGDRTREVMGNLWALSREREAQDQPGFSRVDLVVDATGVGVAAIDLLRERKLRPVPVTITGSDRQTTREDGVLSVGKSYLVSRMQVLLQTGRLHLPATPEADVLVNELKEYQVDIRESGHATFNARSGKHDDLVLALALAVAVALPKKRPWLGDAALFVLPVQGWDTPARLAPPHEKESTLDAIRHRYTKYER